MSVEHQHEKAPLCLQQSLKHGTILEAVDHYNGNNFVQIYCAKNKFFSNPLQTEKKISLS